MIEYSKLNPLIKFITFPILILAGPNAKTIITKNYTLFIIYFIINIIGFSILFLILLY
jgi:hypothetical protein